MPSPATLSGKNRRGNPNWGRPIPPQPGRPTEFERRVQQLGLHKQTYASSAELKRWCERNRNHFYVPEWLLERWGIQVELSYGNGP